MNINSEGATKLLEAMLADSGNEFESGVRDYVEALREERSSKKKLEEAFRLLSMAHNRKTVALKRLRAEYKFLSGKEPVCPPIDAEYVLSRLIMGVLEGYDSDIYDYIISRNSEAESNGNEDGENTENGTERKDI